MENGRKKTQLMFWTVLFYTLVAPFLASLAAALGMLAAPKIGLALDLPQPQPPLGPAIVFVYVWSAMPAALAGGLLAALAGRGQSGPLWAASAGILAFAAASLLLTPPPRHLLTGLAAMAGLVSMAVWLILKRLGLADPA